MASAPTITVKLDVEDVKRMIDEYIADHVRVVKLGETTIRIAVLDDLPPGTWYMATEEDWKRAFAEEVLRYSTSGRHSAAAGTEGEGE